MTTITLQSGRVVRAKAAPLAGGTGEFDPAWHPGPCTWRSARAQDPAPTPLGGDLTGHDAIMWATDADERLVPIQGREQPCPAGAPLSARSSRPGDAGPGYGSESCRVRLWRSVAHSIHDPDFPDRITFCDDWFKIEHGRHARRSPACR